MNSRTLLIAALTAVLLLFEGQAQKLSAKILDSVTQQPIPYVTVRLNNKGVITNEEGKFTFLLDATIATTDSLHLSSIGYRSLGKPIAEFTQPIIYLSPKAIELKEVIVSNKNYTPAEILERVQDSLEKNYRYGFTKKRLFLRETYHSSIDQTDYRIKESTIAALNKTFLDSLIRTIPKQDTYYTEVLADLLGNDDKGEQKIELIKAAELYDKSKRLDYENIEEKLNEIIKKNVKTDSYFKVKSGLFGAKVETDAIFDEAVDSTDVATLNAELEKKKEAKEQERKNFAFFKGRTLGKLYTSLPIFKNSPYNVLWKPNRYQLSLEDFSFIGDKALYVIRFTPKRSETYKGTLYINADDFALVKMDFENVEALRDFKLLGVSLNEYMAKGSMLFDKNKDGHYGLKYFEVTKGNLVGFKRPVKIIEKNKNVKGRRKQNELHLKVDAKFSAKSKYEIIVFEESAIEESQFEALTESNTVLPQYMPNYDPEFWKGYTIMEPNTAIKKFTSEVSSAE